MHNNPHKSINFCDLLEMGGRGWGTAEIRNSAAFWKWDMNMTWEIHVPIHIKIHLWPFIWKLYIILEEGKALNDLIQQ